MNNSQFQLVQNGFSVSNHHFLNTIANGITKVVGETVPGLKLQYVGKSISNNKISAMLVGQIVLDDANKIGDASNKVNEIMQKLQNPSNLISIIKE